MTALNSNERLDWDHSATHEVFDDLASVVSTIDESSIIDTSDSEDGCNSEFGNTSNQEIFDDLESVVSTIAESSIIYSSDSEDGEGEELGTNPYTTDFNKTDKCTYQQNKTKEDNQNSNSTEQKNLNLIQNGLQKLTASSTYSNISISDSTNVVLGNIVKINGDFTINVVNNNIEVEKKTATKADATPNKTDFAFRIQPRKTWLIRKPKEKFDCIEEPVKLVIISHTATSNNIDESEYIEVIRDIQIFHIDTQGWNDIAYNFLISCDGTVFEGRGWGVEGAHCFSYNNRSIGISFIGRFKEVLPTPNALKACKELLRRGVDEGHLSNDYKLLGHCQCSTTESPGDKFYEEIKTWSHFYNKSLDDDL